MINNLWSNKQITWLACLADSDLFFEEICSVFHLTPFLPPPETPFLRFYRNGLGTEQGRRGYD